MISRPHPHPVHHHRASGVRNAAAIVMAAGLLLMAPPLVGQERIEPDPEPVRLQRAVELSADSLDKLRDLTERRGVPRGFRNRPLVVDDLEAGETERCTDPDCYEPTVPLDGELERRTPDPSGPVWETGLRGIDPQIAVSATNVVVGRGSRLTVFSRAGTLELDVSVRQFFKPLWDPANPTNINTFLNLAPNIECDVYDQYLITSETFCLDAWYDVRVIYDEHRDRFWIAALARNENTREGEFDPTVEEHTMEEEIGSRRSKLVLAVSKTDDFFDGFYLYWWDAVFDDGVCSDPTVDVCPGSIYRPGDSGDYPAIGISEHVFIHTNGVVRRDPEQVKNNQGRYQMVTLWDADGLASGAPSGGWVYTMLDPNGNMPTVIQPAVHFGRGWERHFLANIFGNSLLVWSVGTPLASPPVIDQVQVPLVDAINIAKDGPQPDFPSGADSVLVSQDNIRDVVMNAMARNGRLHLAWHDCRNWTGAEDECVAAARVVRMDVSDYPTIPTSPASGFRDRTFGLRNMYDDPEDEVVSYAHPVVAVNQNDDVALVYTRTSADTVFFEARYSVWFDGQPDLLPSNVLHSGSYPLGRPTDDPEAEFGGVHYGGIGVDPFDDTTIWMAQFYSMQPDPKKEVGDWRIAVGRVFGQTHPDLEISDLTVKQKGSSIDTVSVTVRNRGDGPAGPSLLQVFLSADDSLSGSDLLLAQVPTPGGLPPGVEFTHVLSSLGSIQGWGFSPHVIALTDGTDAVAEYEEDNNTASRRLLVRGNP